MVRYLNYLRIAGREMPRAGTVNPACYQDRTFRAYVDGVDFEFMVQTIEPSRSDGYVSRIEIGAIGSGDEYSLAG